MENIYFDNAATTFPKPPGLGAAVGDFIDKSAANIKRGTAAYNAENTVYEARMLLSELFDNDDPARVVFTSGITASINMLLRGLLKFGDHIVTSSMEHHAVMRPLELMKKQGIEYSIVKARPDGSIDVCDVEKAIKGNTKLVIINHASNVCGTVLPAGEIGELCKNRGIYFALDSAQTAGVIDISVKKMNIDFLAFAGHKGLMGPQGIGGFVISEKLAAELDVHIAGGTGSYSDLYDMPPELPDKFEAGTLNIPGIAGLRHSLRYILNEGIEKIYRHEEQLRKYFVDKIKDLPVKIVGVGEKSVGVVSVSAMFADNGIVAARLAEAGVAVRYGLHCAPSAHKTLGTDERGTIRFSFGYFNTKEEIDRVYEILKELLIG